VPSDLILVVDDDSSLRRVMQMQLVEAGYRVELASAGAEAHRLLIEHRPKLVITDLRMPDLDGIELLRRLAQEEIQTTVIMITAFGSIESAVEAMRLGAYDYITKPIDYEALVLPCTALWSGKTSLKKYGACVLHLTSGTALKIL